MLLETINKERERDIMRYEFLRVIDTVCKMSDIDLRISDIKKCFVIRANEEYYDTVFLHCRNDKEMFEFNMSISMHPDYFSVIVTEVEGSPYPCDNVKLTIR